MRSSIGLFLLIFAGFLGMRAEALPSLAPAVLEAEADLEARPHAIDETWRRLSRGGLPLIEPHPDDAALARVTFLYKSPPGTAGVRLDSVINVPYAAAYVDDYREDFTLPLTPVGGDEIWAITLDVARDVQASYSFLVDTPGGERRRSDPANPRRLRGEVAEALLVLENAPGQALTRPLPPRLQLETPTVVLESNVLDRTVFLKLVRGTGAAPDAPLLIIWDSFLWDVRAPVYDLLERLQTEAGLPPMNAVLIDQLDAASARLNYSDQAPFLASELLPWLAREHELRPSPVDVILAGASRRGLAMSRAALDRPAAFGAVISLSGSFYWSPPGEAPLWLTRALPPAGDRAPRFHLAAGNLETVHTSTNQGHVMLDANRAMTASLAAAGYPVRYQVFPGGHDVAAWRVALANGLIALYGTEAD